MLDVAERRLADFRVLRAIPVVMVMALLFVAFPRQLNGILYTGFTRLADGLTPWYHQFALQAEPHALLVSSRGSLPLIMIDGSRLPDFTGRWEKRAPEGTLALSVAWLVFACMAPANTRAWLAGMPLTFVLVMMLCALDMVLQIQALAFAPGYLQQLPLDQLSGDDENMARYQQILRHGHMIQPAKDFLDAGGRLLLAGMAGFLGANLPLRDDHAVPAPVKRTGQKPGR